MQLDEAITMEPDELSLFVSTKVLITSATSFVSPCPHFFGHMKIRAETKCAIIQIFDHHVTFECHSVYTYECLGNYVSAKAVFTLQGNWRWQWRLRSQYGAYGWAISHTFISNKEKVAAIILLWIYFLSLLHPRAVFYKLRNHSRSNLLPPVGASDTFFSASGVCAGAVQHSHRPFPVVTLVSSTFLAIIWIFNHQGSNYSTGKNHYLFHH